MPNARQERRIIPPYYTHALWSVPVRAARLLVISIALAVTLRAASDPHQGAAAATADLSRQSGGAATAERFWAQWRGPYATGVSKFADPPTEWSETKNIRWKVEIPGRGSASPVIWGDRVFLLSAVPIGLDGTAAHSPRGGVNPRGR